MGRKASGGGSQSCLVACPFEPKSHGSIEEKEEGAREGGGGGGNDNKTLKFVVMAPNMMCQYPC
jgi:hypothetical protein